MNDIIFFPEVYKLIIKRENTQYKAMENKNICYMKIKDAYYYGMYADFKVIILISTDYINASKLCSNNKKFISNWIKTQHAQELIASCKKLIPPSAIECKQMISSSERIQEPLIIIDQGDNDLRGTYLHPLLIPHVASWVSAKFGMFVSKIVNNYLTQEVEGKMKRMEEKMKHTENEKETLSHLLQQNEENTRSLLRQMEENEAMKEDDIHRFQQQILQNENEKQNIILQLQYKQQFATVSLPDARKQHKFAVIVINSAKYKYYVIRTQKGKFDSAMELLKQKYPHLTLLLTLEYTPNGFDLYNKMKQTMGPNISFRGNYFNTNYSEDELDKQIHILKND